jgi:hypothetical protein
MGQLRHNATEQINSPTTVMWKRKRRKGMNRQTVRPPSVFFFFTGITVTINHKQNHKPRLEAANVQKT